MYYLILEQFHMTQIDYAMHKILAYCILYRIQRIIIEYRINRNGL